MTAKVGGGEGKMGKGAQNVETGSYEINQSWGGNVDIIIFSCL